MLEHAVRWHDAGRGVALATVARTWGSAPCPVGSHLVVSDAGSFLGSVSGGCVEAAVVTEALEVIASGRPRLLEFGVSDDAAIDVGLACGGRVAVLVERLDETESLRRLAADLRARRGSVRATELRGGARAWIRSGAEDAAGELCPALVALAHDALREGRPLLAEVEGGTWLLNVYEPPLRLIVVGAVHIAQALAPMAAFAGYEVTIVDPRAAFGTEERFPGISLCHDWPDRALEALAPDARTAVVTLTHDPKLDDPALAAALHSEAFYVGALGSTRTHEARLARLRARGLGDGALAHIHAPVGLPLGARGPAEIAVSILAQVVACRRRAAA